MFNIPDPKPGEITAVTITTPDLDASLKFWERLGFKELMRFDFPFHWIQVSDGALLIMLRKDPEPYIALTCYADDVQAKVAGLEKNGITFFQKPAAGDILSKHLIKTPDGQIISILKNIENFFSRPAGPTMLRMAQQDYFNPDKYVNQACGMFGELAHPVQDLEASIAFWEKMGFAVTAKFQSPYPWAILTDGQAVAGLHQTQDFSSPAITYFASDSKDKIAKLIENGLTGYREKGNASNIIIDTPEKQQFFLFRLGM